MLGKLIKYDLMADWKKYSALYAATLLVSVMLFTTGKIKEHIRDNRILVMVENMFGILFTTLIAAIGIMVVVLTVMRFYKNVMRDEGYLTHTLPVHTWQILVSKLISSYVWFFSAFIIGGICIGIGIGEPLWFLDFFKELAEAISTAPGSAEKTLIIQLLTIITISIVLAPFFIMAHAYFCFAIGNLSNSRKLGVSVLAFFGVNIAENIISTIILSVIAPKFVDDRWADEMMPMIEVFRIANSVMVIALIISFVVSLAFFIASERIFAKKLNLE